MKSLLFSTLLFFSVLSLQTLKADTSDSVSLPAIYCAVNELIEGENYGSVTVIDPSSQSVTESYPFAFNMQGITSVGVPNPNQREKGGVPYVYTSSYIDDEVPLIGVFNASAEEIIYDFVDLRKGVRALAPVIADGTPYVYCANYDDNTITVINAQVFAKNPNDWDKAIVGTIPTGSSPISLAPVIADGTPYVYCANYDDNTITVINSDKFITNPKEAVVGTIPLKGYYDFGASGLTAATFGGTPYVYCCDASNDLVTIINAKEFIENPKAYEPKQIKVAGRPVALTSFVKEGALYVYCAGFDSQKISVIRQTSNIDSAEVVEGIYLKYRLDSITSLVLKSSSKPNDTEYYVYCGSSGSKKILVFKQKNGSSTTDLIKTINLESSPVGLTPVYPVSSTAVSTTSSQKALTNGKHVGGG